MKTRKRIIRKKFLCTCILVFLSLNIFSQDISNNKEDRPSVALVLSGGGARGFSIIPILEAIEELEIPIDIVIGNSIGSIVGGLYCAGYSTSEMVDIFKDMNWAKIFQDKPISPVESILGNRSTFTSPISFSLQKNLTLNTGGGLSTGQNVYMLFKKLTAKIPSYIHFDSLVIPFRAVAVDLLTGNLDVIKEGDLAEAIRSSMSIPAVFKPFPIDEKLYVDGLVQNNIPIQQAVDLGYDIIIAVELGEELQNNPDFFESTPLSTAWQVLSIFTFANNSYQHELADVLLIPPVENYNMFDFQKSMEIYEQSEKQKDAYKAKLKKVKQLIYPNSEEEKSEKNYIQKGNFSLLSLEGKQETLYGSYKDLDYIEPKQIVIKGAVHSDLNYIKLKFNEIAGKPLSENLLESFVNAVYSTGNYSLVLPRVDIRYDEPRIELQLHQLEKENWVIIPNASFEGTLSESSISKLTFSLDVQFRGLTGTGSVLSLKADMINDFAAALMYMQPLGPHTYFQFAAAIDMEQEFITSGFSTQKIQGNRMTNTSTELSFGARFNDYHRMQFGGAIYWLISLQNESESLIRQFEEYPDVEAKIAAPLNINYIFNTFDYPVFPSRGFYVKLDDTGVFPLLGQNTPLAFNLCKIDFSAAIPVSNKFSIIFNLFAGSDITRQLRKIPDLIPVFGYGLGDRMFFPNISGKSQYGTHKGAAQIVFQFQPWENLTIMGGQMFFSVSGALGEVAMDYTDFTVKGIKWNASVNAGIRINRTFSVMFRVGAGTTSGSVMPYLSLDFGSIRY